MLFQLLVCFAAERLKTTPSALSIEQLDATLVLAFLEHLENERGNCSRTRNSRLAAIKTFFRFWNTGYRHVLNKPVDFVPFH